MVIVDIETYAIADAEQYLPPLEVLPPPDLDGILAARNLVDPAKVAADLAKRREAAIADHEDRCKAQAEKRQRDLQRCALDADLCRIVALGYMLEDDDRPVLFICTTEDEERLALMAFWRSMAHHMLVTFHGFAFDLPVLMRRSLYLGVEHPLINIDKYRSPHIDLYQRLTYNGLLPAHSLKFYCARLGILIDDVTTGKDIAAMVEACDWEGIRLHCQSDVLATRALAGRLGYLHMSQVVDDDAAARLRTKLADAGVVVS